MTLEDFRRRNGLSYDALARMLGVEGQSPARTVQRWATNARHPRPAHMRRIAEVTKNQVTANDFLAATEASAA